MVCSAVEDVTEEQRKINGGSLNGAGPAGEDSAGKVDCPLKKKSDLEIFVGLIFSFMRSCRVLDLAVSVLIF